MHRPRRDEDYLHTNDGSDSTSESDTDSLFNSSGDEADTTSDTDIDSPLEEVNNNTDDDDDLFDDEVRHPPEYYIAASANLDVGRLRQKRYRRKTRERFDWVKDHHDQYELNLYQLCEESSADVPSLLGGRRRPGIKHTSSLETFWKWYLMVYKRETGQKIDGMVQVQGQDVVKVVAIEKELDDTKRESATINEFKIPEIIYDPTLVLSHHTFLLGMLFKVQTSKSPSIVSPEKLYSLNVLDGINEQQLPLKDALSDDFIFCQAVETAGGVFLARHSMLSSNSVTKPYVLRDGPAKALNESRLQGDDKGEEKYQKACRRLKINEDTRDAFERLDQMTLEHLFLIDAILTLPKTSIENEYQQRIAAVNAITAYCGVEEGPASRRIQRGRPLKVDGPLVNAEEPDALSQAILSIKTEKRPTICFLCVGNPALPVRERVISYTTPSSLRAWSDKSVF
ncbi:hypothetical protein G7Y89_g13019 [Cudoniella acicularis]|uniref:Uncharacterized protein n=1 Tax=Cudoniella acicularis TaxID=354080 RepID=A0A8H4VWU0_9HELO|nr:hypothetical protein G7Y89_g13019 [Cudoniella acicularis]